MKILQINKHHFVKGGADRVYFNTGDLLEKNGNEVIYFSTSHPGNLDCRNSELFVPFVENRERGFISNISNTFNYLYNKDVIRNLDKLIEIYHPDVAHLHLIYGEMSGSVLKSLKSHKIPVVQSIHDYRLLCPANAFIDSDYLICERCRNKAFYQCATRRCKDKNFFYSSVLSLEAYFRKYCIDPVNYIDHFIFVSRFSREKHMEYDKRFSGKSSQVYNFTDISSGELEPHKDNYLLYYGRLSREKGLELLLKTAENLKVNLKIAGTGPMEETVLGYAGRNKNIEYMGYKYGRDLDNLIKGSSFVVVPSECYENNPMTIIESYSFGIPVIGSRLGGIPEILIDNNTGFLFEPRNADDLAGVIKKALQLDQGHYDELSANALRFAEQNFSSATHYMKLMEVYSGVKHNA
jgi:glycosyltransferase involved in cell wall biosynthesis